LTEVADLNLSGMHWFRIRRYKL